MFKKQFVTISDVINIEKNVVWKRCQIYFNYDDGTFYIMIKAKRCEVIKSRKGDFIYG